MPFSRIESSSFLIPGAQKKKFAGEVASAYENGMFFVRHEASQTREASSDERVIYHWVGLYQSGFFEARDERRGAIGLLRTVSGLCMELSMLMSSP